MKRSVLMRLVPLQAPPVLLRQKASHGPPQFSAPTDGFRIQASIGCAASIKLPLYRDWVVRDRSFPPRYIGWR